MLLALALTGHLVTAQAAPRAESKPPPLRLAPAWLPMVAAFDTHVLLVGLTSIVSLTVFPSQGCTPGPCAPPTGAIAIYFAALGGGLVLATSGLIVSLVMRGANQRRRAAQRVTFDGVALRF